jgi:hypothetical protein
VKKCKLRSRGRVILDASFEAKDACKSLDTFDVKNSDHVKAYLEHVLQCPHDHSQGILASLKEDATEGTHS